MCTSTSHSKNNNNIKVPNFVSKNAYNKIHKDKIEGICSINCGTDIIIY